MEWEQELTKMSLNLKERYLNSLVYRVDVEYCENFTCCRYKHKCHAIVENNEHKFFLLWTERCPILLNGVYE